MGIGALLGFRWRGRVRFVFKKIKFKNFKITNPPKPKLYYYIMAITTAQKTRLGVFVVIGMVILAAFLIVPIAMTFSHRTVIYYTFFENTSLMGLEQGADVKFNGVNIGRVERISYNPDDITKLRVEMHISENFPMRTDMTAGTAIIGITGLRCVEITGGSNDAPILPPGGTIPVRQSMFATIGEQVEDFVGKIETLLDNLAVLTTPDSLQSVKVIIDNLAQLSEDAKYMFADVRRVTPSAVRAMDTVQAALNEVASITRDVSVMTTAFREGIESSNIPQLISQVDGTITSVQTLTDNVTTTIMQTREDFSVTMENLRDATESANQLLRMLSENPSLLIRGDTRERDRR